MVVNSILGSLTRALWTSHAGGRGAGWRTVAATTIVWLGLAPACVADHASQDPREAATNWQGWTVDADGTTFRAATQAELDGNRWPTETYLVVESTETVLKTRNLPVVLGASTVDHVALDASLVTQVTEFHELYFDRTPPRTTTPTFYRLDPSRSSSAQGHVTLDDGGGLYARLSYDGRRHPSREVLAAEANAVLEPIPLPDGSVPKPADLLVVLRPPAGGSLPSGTEAWTTSTPAEQEPLAMFGTIYWCQLHPTNWKALIVESAFEIRAGFRKDLPVQGPGTTDTGWNIVLATSWCMFWDASLDSQAAVDEAKWCEWGLKPEDPDTCASHTCTDAQGFEYPLTGCYRRAKCFANKAWDAVEYADRYLSLPDLLLVQAQTWGSLQGNHPETAVPSCPDDTVSDEVPIVCGLAKSSMAGDLAGASVTPGRPYSLWPPTEPTLDACSGPFTWSHEVGHNYNAFHVSEFMDAPNNSGCDRYKTLMNIDNDPPAGTCTVNGFSVDMAEHMLSTCLPGSCPRSAPYVDHLP